MAGIFYLVEIQAQVNSFLTMRDIKLVNYSVYKIFKIKLFLKYWFYISKLTVKDNKFINKQ